eukprot:8017407-Lingulodinium_polyedra.AAC.1
MRRGQAERLRGVGESTRLDQFLDRASFFAHAHASNGVGKGLLPLQHHQVALSVGQLGERQHDHGIGATANWIGIDDHHSRIQLLSCAMQGHGHRVLAKLPA